MTLDFIHEVAGLKKSEVICPVFFLWTSKLLLEIAKYFTRSCVLCLSSQVWPMCVKVSKSRGKDWSLWCYGTTSSHTTAWATLLLHWYTHTDTHTPSPSQTQWNHSHTHHIYTSCLCYSIIIEICCSLAVIWPPHVPGVLVFRKRPVVKWTQYSKKLYQNIVHRLWSLCCYLTKARGVSLT